jgi:hypothetical protein
MADRDSNSYTFANLLVDVANNAPHMSRQRLRHMYAEQYRNALQSIRNQMIRHADEVFDRHAGIGVEQLSRAKVDADLMAIQAAVEPVKDLVDRVIAHDDKRPTVRQCTFGELDLAVQILEEKFATYHVLITGQSVPAGIDIEVAANACAGWPAQRTAARSAGGRHGVPSEDAPRRR